MGKILTRTSATKQDRDKSALKVAETQMDTQSVFSGILYVFVLINVPVLKDGFQRIVPGLEENFSFFILLCVIFAPLRDIFFEQEFTL